MKNWLLMLVFVSTASTQAFADGNCKWENSQGDNFHSEDTLSNMEACSLFARSILLNGGSGMFGSGMDPVGTKVDGTLFFKAPNGDEKRCEVFTKKQKLDVLSPHEQMVGYLKAEIIGEALSADDQIKAKRQLQVLEEAGFPEWLLIKKLDENLEIICHGPIS